jgi:hypothetical protein
MTRATEPENVEVSPSDGGASTFTREELERRKQQPSNVPCGTCRACCSHDRIFLGRQDDPRAFRWHNEGGYAVLDRKPNGECIYLEASGCSIHDRAPMICRRFDCRIHYLLTPGDVRAKRSTENPQLGVIYEEGRKRLPTLTAE